MKKVCFVAAALLISAFTLLGDRDANIRSVTDLGRRRHLMAEAQGDSKSESQTGCDGRRIYMYNLPKRFNAEVLSNCDAYEIWGNFCDYITNGGLGERTHQRSKSWYRTDGYMLELIFHERIKTYDCLARDPSEADSLFLPYYAGIDALRYLYGSEVNKSHEHGLHLVEWLTTNTTASEKAAWNRRGGADHFLVMGRPAWDLSLPMGRREGSWGTSILEISQLINVTALVVESRSYPWQEQAVPYPTSFHPPADVNLDSWISRVRRSRRPILFSFTGGGGTGSSPNIRRSIRIECAQLEKDSVTKGTCEVVDCDKAQCEHEPGIVMRAMMRADFCLQPPGDTPTRRATFESIVAGCIPVFFEPQGAYSQYTWHLGDELSPDDYSVMIPKDDVVQGGVRISQVLGNVSRSDVARLRRNVIALLPRVIYRHPRAQASYKDAFDIAVDGVLRKVRTVSPHLRRDFS